MDRKRANILEGQLSRFYNNKSNFRGIKEHAYLHLSGEVRLNH